MIVSLPKCYDCKRFNKKSINFSCEKYTEEIPNKIKLSKKKCEFYVSEEKPKALR